MSGRGETEAYLAAELDSLTQAHTAGDQAAVTRRIEHVRAEAGPETAAVLERMLKEQEARRLAPPQPEFTPTAPASGGRELAQPSRTKLLIVFSTVAAALLVAVTVLVTVTILRPPTTATTSPPPQATISPTGPTTTPPTTTSSTNVPPPVALSTAPPPAQTWTAAWPQPKRITMPGDTNAWMTDLEIPKVEKGSGADAYYYDGGLYKGDGILMGTGPATLPAPGDCFTAAQTLPVGQVQPVRDMVPGTTALCIVTGQGSLVWLHLLSGGGPETSGNQWPTLTFELMKWKKAN
ncbi:MAG: hypothetical protein ACRDRS_03385 [Pseudonocardiaceae bacterium]